MRNHSATHLLHRALRDVLGAHVAQKGSLGDEQRTRFDFSHNAAVTADEIAEIEDRVNRAVLANVPVRDRRHTSELQSLMRISYAVFCLKKKRKNKIKKPHHPTPTTIPKHM